MSANVAVVILAGGEGGRIGGGKPLKLLSGRRLIDRALDQARHWSRIVAISVREEAQVFPVDAALIRDEREIEGPVAGLVSALRLARDTACDFLLTIPADMPFLPPDLLERLLEAIPGRSCSLASSGGQVHPVCGLWRTSSFGQVPEYLASGRRSLKGLAQMVGCVNVDWPRSPTDPFFNINSAEDLAEAERQITG